MLSRPEHTRVLMIIAGCPTGVTDYNLMRLHHVAPAVIYDLIDTELVTAHHETVGTSTKRYTIIISDKGRKALNGGAP